ncbi:MAG: Gldg family protein [Syntrophales bacterium]
MSTTKFRLFIRRCLLWGNILLAVLLVLGICTFIEIIGFNHKYVIDLTPEKIFTLSDKTQNILASLDADVNVITFYKMGEREQNAAVLDMFTSASPRIKYLLTDMDRNPGKARVYGAVHSGDTYIEYKGKKKYLPVPQEDLLINAILEMSQDRKKVLFYSRGHGEKDAYSSLEKEIKTENWKVEDLYLAEKEDIPSRDRSVLMIADPEKDFFEHEINMLSRYLLKGGKIILLLEPFIDLPNLKSFLEKYQILLTNDIIIDKENKLLGGDYLAPIIPYLSKTQFTETLRSPLFFSTARSVDIMGDLNFKLSSQILANSADHSWTKTGKEKIKRGEINFQEKTDRSGPVPVAVWITLNNDKVQDQQSQGELICIGDSDFISDSFWEVMGNKDFFLNTVEWLARDNTLISITRRKGFDYEYHHLDASQGRFLFWISVVILPAIFLVIGIIIITFRRVRG